MVTESVSSLGREARGPKAAGRNKLQVADVFFVFNTKLKEAPLIMCCHEDTWS